MNPPNNSIYNYLLYIKYKNKYLNLKKDFRCHG